MKISEIEDVEDARRFLGYAAEFVVGDIRVHKTPFNHGWTLIRDEGRLVWISCGEGWVDSASRFPGDVMRFFAYLVEALGQAEVDYIARTGQAPTSPHADR